MYRWWAAAAIVSGLASGAVLATPGVAAASRSGVSVKITPNHGLVGGQTVTITGRGLARTAGGKPLTWFAAQCTAAVHGHLDTSTDTPHCDISTAVGIKVGHNGSFTAHLRVISGIVGDGYCGTPGHATCVIGVGTAQGAGTVATISFKVPPAPASATTTTG